MKLIFALLRYTGLPFFFRELVQRHRVTIVLLHDIDKQTGQKVFSFLQKRYSIISLADFLEASRSKRSLPPKSMVITFDDGHIRNYELLSVVQELHIPITIFLCAGIINTRRRYWFKHPAAQGMKEQLKKMPNKERLNILEDLEFTPEREYKEAEALNMTQINEMKTNIDFQAHTMFHPCLPTCTDEEVRETLSVSKTILETDFQLPIYALAYPNGDYCDRDVELTKATGYQCAVTVDDGYNTINSDLFRLKRLDLSDSSNLNEVAVKASGVWAFLKRIFPQNPA